MTSHSPRTLDEPMAFTPDEFCRGAVAAWVTFMLLLVCTLIVTGVSQSGLPWGPPLSMITLYLMYGVPIGGVVSAVIALIASPLVRLIARRLAGTPWLGIHVAVYTTFGLLLGITIAVTWVLLSRGDLAYAFTTAFPWLCAGACALSVVGGWAWTVWRTTRPARRRRIDPDAVFEDGVGL